jgi:F0F1-type ATP synthase assembly protein I
MNNLFSSTNLKIFAVSFVLLIIGYVCLGQGPVNNPLSMSVAPIILVISYCVLIPIALAFRGKDKAKSTQDK